VLWLRRYGRVEQGGRAVRGSWMSFSMSGFGLVSRGGLLRAVEGNGLLS
jgi:hypothetical protein